MEQNNIVVCRLDDVLPTTADSPSRCNHRHRLPRRFNHDNYDYGFIISHRHSKQIAISQDDGTPIQRIDSYSRPTMARSPLQRTSNQHLLHPCRDRDDRHQPPDQFGMCQQQLAKLTPCHRLSPSSEPSSDSMFASLPLHSARSIDHRLPKSKLNCDENTAKLAPPPTTLASSSSTRQLSSSNSFASSSRVISLIHIVHILMASILLFLSTTITSVDCGLCHHPTTMCRDGHCSAEQ